ncbi:hypothetical protein AWL63_18425 [Sphingomonas panacis]|uniref:Uncharacterized protein n=1 Tax=Sphingomonas panacis TaxID=1560345 RepID=A0A1B3ZDV9_9SPHN|nr:hypothetical protein [Sphingomonas panacis]AOH85618.1 hypothetical protein AWL63_18425 [Sphingomonas panacis]
MRLLNYEAPAAALILVVVGFAGSGAAARDAEKPGIVFEHAVKPSDVTRQFDGRCGGDRYSVALTWDTAHPSGFISLLSANARSASGGDLNELQNSKLAGRAISEAVIDQCTADGARVRLATTAAYTTAPRLEYMFFDVSKTGEISNPRFD